MNCTIEQSGEPGNKSENEINSINTDLILIILENTRED